MTQTYPRDLVGYNGKPPKVEWPNKARIALSFVLNYEEGSERCVLHGDDESEKPATAFVQSVGFFDQFRPRRRGVVPQLYRIVHAISLWQLPDEFRDGVGRHRVYHAVFRSARRICRGAVEIPGAVFFEPVNLTNLHGSDDCVGDPAVCDF